MEEQGLLQQTLQKWLGTGWATTLLGALVILGLLPSFWVKIKTEGLTVETVGYIITTAAYAIKSVVSVSGGQLKTVIQENVKRQALTAEGKQE